MDIMKTDLLLQTREAFASSPGYNYADGKYAKCTILADILIGNYFRSRLRFCYTVASTKNGKAAIYMPPMTGKVAKIILNPDFQHYNTNLTNKAIHFTQNKKWAIDYQITYM